MSPNPSKADIIQAILTNQSLTDDEKTLLIDEFINEIKREYPDLKYHATKADVTDTQLKLTKEIKELDLKITKEISDTKKEIKDLDVKLTKEIKDLDVKLTKEISDTRQEIVNSKLETIKWVAGMLFVQTIAIIGIFLTAFKLFMPV